MTLKSQRYTMFRKTPTIKLTPNELQYLLNHGRYNTLKMLKTGEVYCTRTQQTVLIKRYKPRKLQFILIMKYTKGGVIDEQANVCV